MGWYRDIIEKRRKRHLLSDVRVQKIDLVASPAIRRKFTVLKSEEEETDALIKRVLRAAGVTTKLEKEQSTMASPNPIPLIKAFTNELDGRGEDQRASIQKSATGALTMEGRFAPKFYELVRGLRKSDRSMSALEAEERVRTDGGLGGRLWGLAFDAFSGYDSDEHLQRIMKANPDSLTKLALLIMKEAI